MAEHKPAQEGLLDSLSELPDAELPAFLRVAIKGWLRALSRRRTSTDVGELVARARVQLKRVDALLDEFEREVANESQAISDVALSGNWWPVARRRIGVLRREESVDSAVAEWLAAWALALSADEFELGIKIARSSVATAPRPYARAMAAVAEILTGSSEDPPDLRPQLRVLLTDEARLRVESAAVLGALLVRSLLDDGLVTEATEVSEWLLERLQATSDDPLRSGGSTASPSFATASTLPGNHHPDYWRTLALAVGAEAAVERDEPESAQRLIDRALTLAKPAPDVFLVATQLAERERAWLSADAYCDQALDRGADPRKLALGRPVPARLRVREASRLRESDPAAALDQLREALESGISGDGDYPEIEVLLEEASLLQQLAREPEASAAMVEAANRLQWSGFTARALELFRTACQLDGAPASSWWAYGEALRDEAEADDGTVDRDLLRSAAEAMTTGLHLDQPGPDDGWVLVTQGLIVDSLHPETDEGLLWLERALLHDDAYLLPYGFLALALRRHGHLHAALTAAEAGAQADSTSDLLREVYISLLYDHGDFAAGLAYVDQLRVQFPDDGSLGIARATFQQRLGNPLDAARTLESLVRDQDVRLELASCLEVLGERDRARREFDLLLKEARADDDPTRAGWAAYRLGDVEAAIDLYTDLAERAPGHTSYQCDLGQMHLARGDEERGDLDRGEALLRGGVRQGVSPDDLLRLQTIELTALRGDLIGRRHADSVEDILRRIDPEIARRRSELLAPRPVPDTLWGRLCSAREAVHRGDPATAVAIYCAVLDDEEIPAPEARFGLLRAALALFAEADRTAAAGDLLSARPLWDQLDPAATRLAEGDHLAVALAARRAVAAVALGDRPAQPHLNQALRHDLGHLALEDAIGLLADDRVRLWRLYDGLTELAGTGGDLSTEHRAIVARLASQLNLESAYRLRVEDVPRAETTRVVNPLEIRLGPAHAVRKDDLRRGVADLRVALGEEMGVRIPSIRRKYVPDPAHEHVEIRVYGEVVDRLWLDPDHESCVDELLTAVGRTLRLQLHRLLGPDDVRLWLADWSPELAGRAAWEPRDELSSLRLARVLRMLLREGVPIVDRTVILDAFLAADSADCETPLTALRQVRRALSSERLGVRTDTGVDPLPPELEKRIAGFLGGPENATWIADRASTTQLVYDLRAWLDGLTAVGSGELAERAILVEDARVRPFAWRLLARERPRLRVLAREELR